MEYIQLFSKLEEQGYRADIYGNRRLNPDLIHARILTGQNQIYSPSTLYLAPAHLLPEPELEIPIILFCLEQSADFCRYEESAFQIAVFDSEISQGDFLNFMANIHL